MVYVLILLAAASLAYSWFVKPNLRSKYSGRTRAIYSTIVCGGVAFMIIVVLKFGLQLF